MIQDSLGSDSCRHGFYFKRCRLEFAEFMLERTPEPIIRTYHQLFFHERLVETDQDPPGAGIFHIDLEVLLAGPGIEKPIPSGNLHDGTYRGGTKVLEGYIVSPILPGSGVVAEEGCYAAYPSLGKGMNSHRTDPFNGINRHGKFPEKHVFSLIFIWN
jgi:hypothetical protein